MLKNPHVVISVIFWIIFFVFFWPQRHKIVYQLPRWNNLREKVLSDFKQLKGTPLNFFLLGRRFKLKTHSKEEIVLYDISQKEIFQYEIIFRQDFVEVKRMECEKLVGKGKGKTLLEALEKVFQKKVGEAI